MTKSQLGQFCEIIQGGRRRHSGKDLVESGYPAYGAGGCNGFLPEAEFDRRAVILSAVGARCGKCFLAEGEWASLANTQLIFPDPHKADAKFLWYQLNDEGRWPRNGLAQPFIKPSDVKSHLVYLPSLAEQRRIVSILDRAESVRQNRAQSLDLLDELSAAVFFEMFGDPAGNPYGFEVSKLGRVAEFYSGNSLPAGEPFNEQSDGFLLLKVSDLNLIGNEVVIQSSTNWSQSEGSRAGTCSKGAILFPKRGGAIATNKKRKLLRPAILDPNLMAVAPDKTTLHLDYLFGWFKLFRLEDIASGSSVPQLNKQDLEPLQICIPPMHLQISFSERCLSILSLESEIRANIVASEALFMSVRTRLFSGEA